MPGEFESAGGTPCIFQEPSAVVDQSRLGVRNPRFATGLQSRAGVRECMSEYEWHRNFLGSVSG